MKSSEVKIVEEFLFQEDERWLQGLGIWAKSSELRTYEKYNIDK